MRSKFLKFADEVRFSFWFLPALMVVGAIVLFWAMVYLDEVLDQPETGARRRVYTGHAEGARARLSTIAGSIISVASVTFGPANFRGGKYRGRPVFGASLKIPSPEEHENSKCANGQTKVI